ncbi:TetR family transcriptional regulator [Mycobacterium florentinum]|uniref:TetR family transcriptional regulator n=1 Tax=Mycobacterium florentinum TaxID=292462 RepID=A0A1X1U0K0_MYCFL|nr:TetR/AcrR family transcriptional regulator [Mycobacterium florentinum]MCV7412720.1 TetR/AcrR family transcriptional regulator [Mycobacterium florentinum]ORV50362.1 TetR family transcriptional regulator [Mycobacterium florentinum]BBX82108.1 TetR family transcriptional regulator [Mycobacterium florentinum]
MRGRFPVTLHDVAARKPSTRLSADDWLQAGYTLLAEEGARALKIERLCQQVGATRGSFYWHFEDMDGYRAALVESWKTFREQDRQSLNEIDTLPPRERLSAMMISLVRPQHWILERAMREWARTDEAAAANIRDADRRLLRSVAKAYGDCGFSPEDAKLRAELTFAAGIGLLHLTGSATQAQKLANHERFLDLMLGESK